MYASLCKPQRSIVARVHRLMRFILNALFTAIFVVALSGTIVLPKPAVVEPSPTPTPEVSIPEVSIPEVTIKNIVTLKGIATWYDATKNNAWYTRKNGGSAKNQQGGPYRFYGAAGPELRKYRNFTYASKPYTVLITSVATGRSVLVWVVDWCSCNGRVKVDGDERLIDLAPEVWDALGVSKSRGIMKIKLAILDKLEDPR